MSLKDFSFLYEIRGSSLNISLSSGWLWIRCHLCHRILIAISSLRLYYWSNWRGTLKFRNCSLALEHLQPWVITAPKRKTSKKRTQAIQRNNSILNSDGELVSGQRRQQLGHSSRKRSHSQSDNINLHKGKQPLKEMNRQPRMNDRNTSNKRPCHLASDEILLLERKIEKSEQSIPNWRDTWTRAHAQKRVK